MGGVVNDTTEIYSNIFRIAFSYTKLLTCATHIRRKVSVGKGNGAYSKHVNANGFLADTVIHDMWNLTNCVHDSVFETYQNFVKKAWVAANKTPLWITFSGNYIDDENFSNFHAGFLRCLLFERFLLRCSLTSL